MYSLFHTVQEKELTFGGRLHKRQNAGVVLLIPIHDTNQNKKNSRICEYYEEKNVFKIKKKKTLNDDEVDG